MKKVMFLLVAFYMAFGFLACEKKENPVSHSECGSVETQENEFVTMQIAPSQIPLGTQFNIVIENHTTQDMIYDDAFSLEYFDGNNWGNVSLYFVFEDIAYILKSGETIQLQPISTADLKTGQYRINKSVTLDKNYHLCCEFEIL
ncbi:MAG: hypothetical protein LBB41_07935 [Prevotellaceae bacterium]|jgi:hypothetical protein|nr:hypothetical protein [Prevotellaceae bacterium]